MRVCMAVAATRIRDAQTRYARDFAVTLGRCVTRAARDGRVFPFERILRLTMLSDGERGWQETLDSVA